MQTGQLYLAAVRWRSRDVIADICPGKLPVSDAFNPERSVFEAHIPAYARESGREMQLAVRSGALCAIVSPDGSLVPMAEHVHADTGAKWWIEKGPWVDRGAYHDAPSFHRPGGTVTVRIGQEDCLVHLYDPSITERDFALLLDDVKNWCWRMAIDESCYVTVEQDSEVRVLSTDYLRHAHDFIRNIETVLETPHCELREATSLQRIDRLRPNNHSLRFLAQRGNRPAVPGRSAKQHFNTAENRFVRAMLKRVISMLQWTAMAAMDRSTRFRRTAAQYEDIARDLRERTTETINRGVLEENLRRARIKRDEEVSLLASGHSKLQVTSSEGYNGNFRQGRYNNQWALVELGDNEVSDRIRAFLNRCGNAVVIGQVAVRQAISQYNKPYYRASVKEIVHLDVWRDYASEVAKLEERLRELQASRWECAIPAQVVAERRREAATLSKRAESLQEAAKTTTADATTATGLLEKARRLDAAAGVLGITPDMRFVPTMVFLQSPPYAGALSAYRQLLAMTGVDEMALDDLFELEGIGMRDWPGVYERWCLIALLRVLQDDFKFVFDKQDVRAHLLRHCTGKSQSAFSVVANRGDMRLSLRLFYQPTLPNRRVPDFLVALTDQASGKELHCVLDAKSCAFQHRPSEAPRNPLLYIDDCLDDLINTKDYGQGGRNRVFVMHSAARCRCNACAETGFERGPITQPTTPQSWAGASAYGGDAVFAWETERAEHHHGAVLVRPEATLPDLRRLFLMLIQFGLGRSDICASCGCGGSAVIAQPGKGVGTHYQCTKCKFLSVTSHCFNCKKPLIKNQAWWSYHDLHPTDVWNIKCWSCGSLL